MKNLYAISIYLDDEIQVDFMRDITQKEYSYYRQHLTDELGIAELNTENMTHKECYIDYEDDKMVLAKYHFQLNRNDIYLYHLKLKNKNLEFKTGATIKNIFIGG